MYVYLFIYLKLSMINFVSHQSGQNFKFYMISNY